MTFAHVYNEIQKMKTNKLYTFRVERVYHYIFIKWLRNLIVVTIRTLSRFLSILSGPDEIRLTFRLPVFFRLNFG